MGNHPCFIMNKYLKIYSLILVSSFCFYNCSSSEEAQKEQKVDVDTVYVFDEIPPEDVFEFESPTPQIVDTYVVQIGAFSSFERAKDFADKSWQKLNREIKVEYKQDKKLYVVWIYPPFNDKASAIKYRTEIQSNGDFRDAWITTIESTK